MIVSENVLAVFGFDTSLVDVKPLGKGLINHTYIIKSEQATYVLQKINTAVFKNPAAIAHNIKWVSDYLAANSPDYYFVGKPDVVLKALSILDYLDRYKINYIEDNPKWFPSPTQEDNIIQPETSMYTFLEGEGISMQFLENSIEIVR